MTDVDPRAEEEEPVGHAVHALTLLAPTVTEYALAGHKTHALALLAPTVTEYAPAGHKTHALALLAPTATEYAPAAHPTQLGECTFTLNLPASHFMQPAPTTYSPARQAVVQTLDPASEFLPAVQLKHTPTLLAAVTVEYVPDKQFVHIAASVAA